MPLQKPPAWAEMDRDARVAWRQAPEQKQRRVDNKRRLWSKIDVWIERAIAQFIPAGEHATSAIIKHIIDELEDRLDAAIPLPEPWESISDLALEELILPEVSRRLALKLHGRLPF